MGRVAQWSGRRAERRAERALRRRLRELDREYGPSYDAPLTGRHLRRAHRRRRREHGPVVPGLVIALGVTTLLLLRDPGATGSRMRDLLGVGDTRLAEVVQAVGDGGSHSFAMTQPGSTQPVSYNPCKPIRYVVNPVGAPEDADELIAAAVETIAEATGFRFQYDGLSSDRRFADRARTLGSAPVLIGWADEEEVPGLAGDVAGLGGSAALDDGSDRLHYVTGMVALDIDAFTAMAQQPQGRAFEEAIVTHELGHVVGLGHVDDPGELMYAENVGRTTLGPGDLEGLAALGAVPC